MEFNLQSFYEQIDTYSTYVGCQDVRNDKGFLIMKIKYIEFDNNLFAFYFDYKLKEDEYILTRCEIKKL